MLLGGGKKKKNNYSQTNQSSSQSSSQPNKPLLSNFSNSANSSIGNRVLDTSKQYQSASQGILNMITNPGNQYNPPSIIDGPSSSVSDSSATDSSATGNMVKRNRRYRYLPGTKSRFYASRKQEPIRRF
jgi:hypothetical protein